MEDRGTSARLSAGVASSRFPDLPVILHTGAPSLDASHAVVGFAGFIPFENRW